MQPENRMEASNPVVDLPLHFHQHDTEVRQKDIREINTRLDVRKKVSKGHT